MSKVIDCSKWTKIVDDSKFIPMSELVKRNAANLGNKVFTAAEANAFLTIHRDIRKARQKKLISGTQEVRTLTIWP